jgi:hypothetical protein
MRTITAIALTISAVFATPSIASAACASGSPDAITSKPSADAKNATDQQATADAKGISEDGQHTPMETDPNAPGVTQSAGGTTTNTQQAEAEIAAAGSADTDSATTASTTGSDTNECRI